MKASYDGCLGADPEEENVKGLLTGGEGWYREESSGNTGSEDQDTEKTPHLLTGGSYTREDHRGFI